MFLSNVRIIYRLSLLVALSLLFLVAQGVYGLGSLSRLDGSVKSGFADLTRIKIAVDQARTAQVDFKKQVQEWKNILIRGQDQEKFTKYSKQFQQEHEAVLATLQKLKTTLGQLRLPADEIDKASEVHRALFASYTAALKSYDRSDPAAGKKVDAQVSGIDREPTQAIDAIVQRISEDGERIGQSVVRDAHALYSYARLMTLLGIAAAVVILGLLSLAIIRSITRPLRESVEFSRQVAAGNLEARLAVQGADEVGMLARTLQDMVASLKEKMLQADQKSREASTEAEKANRASQQAAEAARRAEAGRGAMLQPPASWPRWWRP
jgi:HAMP domain-containing protein